MAKGPFSIRNIVAGILLGMIIILGWLLYPRLTESPPPTETNPPAASNQTTSPSSPESNTLPAAPQIPMPKTTAQNVRNQGAAPQATVAQNAVETSPPPENQPTDLPVPKPEPNAPIANVTNSAADTPFPAPAQVPPLPDSYAEEEAQWQELLSRTMPPEYLPDYPFVDCFTSAARRHQLPLPVLFGLAAYLSNYNPRAVMQGRMGILQQGWPKPLQAMGVMDEQAFLDDPCRQIDLAADHLVQLYTNHQHHWVPTLTAYLKQLDTVSAQAIGQEDRTVMRRIRGYIGEVLESPYVTKTLYPFWTFEHHATALDIMQRIEATAGVRMWLGQSGTDFIIYIPAANENERSQVAELIQAKTGLKGQS